MLRSMLLSLVAMMLSTVAAFGQVHGTVQYVTIVKPGVTVPRYVITESAAITSQFGWALYAQTDRSWSEAYIGPTYTPVTWFKTGAQVGVESKSKTNRYAGFAAATYHQAAASIVREYGPSGGFTATELKIANHSGALSYVYDTPRGHGTKITLNATKQYTAWISAQRVRNLTTLRYTAQFSF